MLQDAGFQQAFQPIRVKFKPSAKDVQVCEESGTDLAQAVRKRARKVQRQAGSGSGKSGEPGLACEPFDHAVALEQSGLLLEAACPVWHGSFAGCPVGPSCLTCSISGSGCTAGLIFVAWRYE